MKLRCKQGDLAVITRGVASHQSNVGKFVSVLKPLGVLGPGDKVDIKADDGRTYRIGIVATRGYFWWCKGQHELTDMSGNKCIYGVFPDQHLMPIRPLGDPLSKEELLGAGAGP